MSSPSPLEDVRNKRVYGTFFHAPTIGAIEVLADALVGIDDRGRISSVLKPQDSGYGPALAESAATGSLLRLPGGQLLIPGLVDLHIHAPQYPQLGTALDVPLEVWLQTHTFPLEARYGDLAFAREAYTALLADLLALGTTTAMFFATIHPEATRLLADISLERGMRAVIGKVAMDDPASCPDYYRDPSADTAIDETAAFIDYVRAHAANRDCRVLPAITPRFIPSCTDALLAGLGELARGAQCHIQTHCSESDWEQGAVLDRYGRSDSESIDRFGLMTRHTVLAHGNFISDGDMDLIGARGAGIAHCPLSNVYFSNAVFPLRRALEKRLHVGLGTDISGGPSASLLDACRMAVAASRLLADGIDAGLPPAKRGGAGSAIDWRTAFHLATAGGGQALDLPVGTFAPGQHFDAVSIDTEHPQGTIRVFAGLDDHEAILQKIIYGASRANIADVWVGGRRVAGGGGA